MGRSSHFSVLVNNLDDLDHRAVAELPSTAFDSDAYLNEDYCTLGWKIPPKVLPMVLNACLSFQRREMISFSLICQTWLHFLAPTIYRSILVRPRSLAQMHHLCGSLCLPRSQLRRHLKSLVLEFYFWPSMSLISMMFTRLAKYLPDTTVLELAFYVRDLQPRGVLHTLRLSSSPKLYCS